jgi:hypothetical protein
MSIRNRGCIEREKRAYNDQDIHVFITKTHALFGQLLYKKYIFRTRHYIAPNDVEEPSFLTIEHVPS